MYSKKCMKIRKIDVKDYINSQILNVIIRWNLWIIGSIVMRNVLPITGKSLENKWFLLINIIKKSAHGTTERVHHICRMLEKLSGCCQYIPPPPPSLQTKVKVCVSAIAYTASRLDTSLLHYFLWFLQILFLTSGLYYECSFFLIVFLIFFCAMPQYWYMVWLGLAYSTN